MTHANAAGLSGGNSVCGNETGNVAFDEKDVDCPDCLRCMAEYYISCRLKKDCINL